MPLVNPYQIFTKPTGSITKRVKQLIGSAPNKQIKEFVQTSKFDSHQLPASQVEHLVSLSLPSDLPRHCLAQGYTHIHFGAIRLALTFHGRKGLPAYSRIALLDTRLKPSTRKEPTFSQELQSIVDVVASTKTPDVLPIQKVNPVSMFLNLLTQTDKPQNTQFIAPVIKPQKDYEEFDNVESFEHLFMAKPENAESTVQFDAEDYEEHEENLNQETPLEFPKSDIKQYFTFDDVPPSKWRERSIKMLTWCTTELQYYTIDVVIKRFLTRLQGRLRDWYLCLGEYRQL
ncbi:hypothetical protein Tco_0658450 [Tanacetum coccineum]